MNRIILMYIFVNMSFFGFSQGEIDLKKVDPLDYYQESAVDKYDWTDPAAKHLVLESVKGNLTSKELNGLKNYLIEYRLPTHNYENYYFRKRANSYLLEWVFEKTGDKKLLNKAIQVARRAIQYRNDNFGKYQISYDRGIAPVWPNFKKTEEYSDGSVGLIPGAGAFAGVPVITIPVRMIAENPDLWEQIYDGETYKNIALILIDEAFKTIDYTYEVFVGSDNLIRYPNNLLRAEWRGKVVIYNRVFPMISGTFPLIDALEIFNIKKDKVEKMEKVNQAMINFFTNDMTFYGSVNTQLVKYPYSQVSQEKNPNKMEDFTHGSLDSRDFQHFYNYGKYGFGDKYVKAMANTLTDVIALGDGIFTERIDGAGGTNTFDSPISYDGFIWYAKYRPELYELIIQHIIDSGIIYRKGVWDAFSLSEILKLKGELVSNSIQSNLPNSDKYMWIKNNTINFSWEQVGTVKIFDLMGRCVFLKSNVTNAFNLGEIKPGIYIVKTSKAIKKLCYTKN